MTTVFTIMSYGGMVLAVACFVSAIILFIKWNIPKVFGDITGRTERKTIERIRSEGYEANFSRKSAIQPATGTGKIKVRKTRTGNLASRDVEYRTESSYSQVIENSGEESVATREEGRTSPIFGEEETAVLEEKAMREEETTILGAASLEEETSVLGSETRDRDGEKQPEAVTTVLAENCVAGVIQVPDEVLTQPGTVKKVLDFIMVHTDDRIE